MFLIAAGQFGTGVGDGRRQGLIRFGFSGGLGVVILVCLGGRGLGAGLMMMMFPRRTGVVADALLAMLGELPERERFGAGGGGVALRRGLRRCGGASNPRERHGDYDQSVTESPRHDLVSVFLSIILHYPAPARRMASRRWPHRGKSRESLVQKRMATGPRAAREPDNLPSTAVTS